LEDELKITGERFHPGLGGQIEAEHVHRYAYISNLVRDRVVLDIASGEGYGGAHLATIAKSVLGVDADSNAVAHAIRHYSQPNLQFKQGTCESIPAESASFDVVVSFETIEHIVEQEQFLREIQRVLRPDGFAIISTPDKSIYTDEFKYNNPFHLKEFYEGEFLEFLKKGFKHVRVLKQRFYSSSVIYGGEAKGEAISFEVSTNGTETFSESKPGLYMIALVSNAENNFSLPKSYLFVNAEITEAIVLLQRESEGQVSTIRQLRNHNLDLDEKLEERELRINALKAERKELLQSLKATSASLEEMSTASNASHLKLLDARTKLSNHQQQLHAALLQEQQLRIKNELLKCDIRQLVTKPGNSVEAWAAPVSVWYKKSTGKLRVQMKGRDETEQLALLKSSGLFDVEYYVSRYADLISAGIDPAVHYLLHGGTEGRDPHPLFSSSYYLAQCPELVASGDNPLVHYLTVGHSRLDPNPFFQTSYYLEQRPEAMPTPLNHYISIGEREGSSPSVLFDSKYYAAQNPDLVSAKINLLSHYMLVGAFDGRQPHPLFDPRYYWRDSGISFLPRFSMQGNMDSRRELYIHANVISEWCQTDEWKTLKDFLSGIDSVVRDPHPLFSSDFYKQKYGTVVSGSPFLHYLRQGSRVREQPHPLFNPEYYLRQYPSLATSNVDLLVHYLIEGAGHGANPSADFDTAFYLGTYADVANSNINPLVHYVTSGMKEGRAPNPQALTPDTGISIAQSPSSENSLSGIKA